MILVFGGTTEGKVVAGILDFLGEFYFYSTKTRTSVEIKGECLWGDMDANHIYGFCKSNNIKVIIDAAHPFAGQLHQNIHRAAAKLRLTTIRYEREYSRISTNPLVKVFPSFRSLVDKLVKSRYCNILALTGVQTIGHFKTLRADQRCYFRILDTDRSRNQAKAQGVDDKNLICLNPNDNANQLIELVEKIKAEILISKESGHAGFFENKIETARRSGIPLWVVQRPVLPEFNHVVDSKKNLLQLIYRLKKTALKNGDVLRSGFTTGTCVTAAAKACFMAIVNRRFPESVEVVLPDGDKTSFLIFPEKLERRNASCIVIKDGGDDPDITHGKEIGCKLTFTEEKRIRFVKGPGIGTITLPGLQLEVGEPAINPVPRQMISSILNELAGQHNIDAGFEVKPFIPEGEELAKKTFNPRVGVISGLSIIGTSGRVIPYSNEAFLSTIKHQMSVVKESGVEEIVLTSGKRSEKMLHGYYRHLPEIAFIHYGNQVGDAIRLAMKSGISRITLGIMLGKAMKLAEGHLDTHSKNVQFNAEFAGQIAAECGYPDSTVEMIKTMQLANAIRKIIPFSKKEVFYREVATRCYRTCKKLMPVGVELKLILITDKEEILAV